MSFSSSLSAVSSSSSSSAHTPSPLVFSREEGKSVHFYYGRAWHTEASKLEEQLYELYHTCHCVLATSGMNATTLVVQALADEHTHIWIGNELYSETPSQFQFWQRRMWYELTTFDVSDGSSLIHSMEGRTSRPATDIVYVESCSNPSGHIFDFSLITALRRSSNRLIVVVDNTWLSAAICNPLDYGADVVVCSLTKYYSAGTCIAGAVLYRNNDFTNPLREVVKSSGLHVSPLVCSAVGTPLKSLKERVRRSSTTTVEVAQALHDSKQVGQVWHPSLKDHPSYKLATQYFTSTSKGILYPSVLAFTIPLSKKKAEQWMKDTGLDYLTSYGAANTKLDPWPKAMNSLNSTSYTRCRLAVGYESTCEEIMKVLKPALEKL